MIRHSEAMSSAIFYLTCESQEWPVNPLKLRYKIVLEILLFTLQTLLRTCSKIREQNALCHGFQGPPTETPTNRLTGAEAPGKTQDAVGLFRITKDRRQMVMVGRNI